MIAFGSRISNNWALCMGEVYQQLHPVIICFKHNSPTGSLLHCSLTKLLRACIRTGNCKYKKAIQLFKQKRRKLEHFCQLCILYACMHACSLTWPMLKCNNCHLIEKLNNRQTINCVHESRLL